MPAAVGGFALLPTIVEHQHSAMMGVIRVA